MNLALISSAGWGSPVSLGIFLVCLGIFLLSLGGFLWLISHSKK